MSESSEKVKRWRRATKQRIIDAMGGGCVCCRYNRHYVGLSLHHLDPSKKELSFAKITANPVSWNRIVKELRKCILVCLICHAEIHGGFRDIPDNCVKFDESYEDYKVVTPVDNCPMCGKEKPIHQKTCSHECAAKKARKVDWDKIDLKDLINKKHSNWTHIGDEIGVSGTAVKKRAKKLALI